MTTEGWGTTPPDGIHRPTVLRRHPGAELLPVLPAVAVEDLRQFDHGPCEDYRSFMSRFIFSVARILEGSVK